MGQREEEECGNGCEWQRRAGSGAGEKMREGLYDDWRKKVGNGRTQNGEWVWGCDKAWWGEMRSRRGVEGCGISKLEEKNV